MAEGFTGYRVDPDKKFRKSVTDALSKVSDLSLIFQIIGVSWFKSNKAIFALRGPGKFADLTDRYKLLKQAKRGFVYPILRASGALEDSLTDPGNSDAVFNVDAKSLILGTRKPYAIFLQGGTSRMKARPHVLIGAEQTGPEEFNERRKAWIAQIEDYVMQVTQGIGRSTA